MLPLEGFIAVALAAFALVGCDARRDAPPPRRASPGALPPGAPAGRAASTDLPELVRVPQAQLLVTSGAVGALPSGHLSIVEPSVRAVALASSAPVAEIRFRHIGSAEQIRPFASGRIKEQIGLKLRARDSCNVIYAMWQIAPDPGIDVLVKRNPGKHTHKACGAEGYHRIRPRRAVRMDAPGDAVRALRAEIVGAELIVRVDGVVVWEGALDSWALSWEGPVGLRADNGRFELVFYARPDAESASPPKVEGKGAGASEP